MEHQIYERVARRDHHAISTVYDQYSGALYGVIIRIVKSREIAEDILQDTFVKIWKYADKYNPDKASYYTWMLNIARNTALDKVRSAGYRNSKKIQRDENSVSENSRLKEEMYVDHIGLTKVLDQLDEKQRAVIDLVYFEGYTQQEVQEALDIPLGTVKTRLRIAMRELRKMLDIPTSAALVLVIENICEIISQYTT